MPQLDQGVIELICISAYSSNSCEDNDYRIKFICNLKFENMLVTCSHFPIINNITESELLLSPMISISNIDIISHLLFIVWFNSSNVYDLIVGSFVNLNCTVVINLNNFIWSLCSYLNLRNKNFVAHVVIVVDSI